MADWIFSGWSNLFEISECDFLTSFNSWNIFSANEMFLENRESTDFSKIAIVLLLSLMNSSSFNSFCFPQSLISVSYTHLRAHETRHDLVCRLLLEKKK